MTLSTFITLFAILVVSPDNAHEPRVSQAFSEAARVAVPERPLSIREHYGNPDNFRTYVIKKPPVYA